MGKWECLGLGLKQKQSRRHILPQCSVGVLTDLKIISPDIADRRVKRATLEGDYQPHDIIIMVVSVHTYVLF